MAKLSDTRFKAYKPASHEVWHGDGPNLWLRMLTSGSKVFILRVKRNGKTKLITSGHWPDYSLQKARQAALERKTKANPISDVHLSVTVQALAEEFYSRIIELTYRRTKSVRGYLDNASFRRWAL